MGQEFTPSMRTLFGVGVHICDGGGGATTLIMNIRKATINGTILVSKSFSVSTGFSGWVYVDLGWPIGIRVVSGDLYVVELQATVNWGWTSAGGGNPYPGGRQILWGVPQTDNDAAFRTYGFYI